MRIQMQHQHIMNKAATLLCFSSINNNGSFISNNSQIMNSIYKKSYSFLDLFICFFNINFPFWLIEHSDRIRLSGYVEVVVQRG